MNDSTRSASVAQSSRIYPDDRARTKTAYCVAALSLLISVALTSLSFALMRSAPAAQTVSPAATKTVHVSQPAIKTDTGWPREVKSGTRTFTIYQPQIDSWKENLLQADAVVAIKPVNATSGTSAHDNAAAQDVDADKSEYGVIHFHAHTEVDKVNRTVTLFDFELTKTDFPMFPEKNAQYQEALGEIITPKVEVISLDRLQAQLSIDQVDLAVSKVPLKNIPPEIIFSDQQAILVVIDGPPVLRPVEDEEKLMRVINTRALILFDAGKRKYFLHLMDGWMQAEEPQQLWSYAKDVPGSVKKCAENIARTGQADLLAGAPPDAEKKPSLKKAVEDDTAPLVYVRTSPAELIQTQGAANIQDIPDTSLRYITNTGNNVFFDGLAQQYFVLISGRWFKSASLDGPWSFTLGKDLPADFAKIPSDHPKASVLASIPGTPQAAEALISNSIPQTAEITRKEAKLTVIYDGQPEFKPIEGTSLQYVANTSVPVIKVDEEMFYSVENGVWFVADSPWGPWTVATQVPAEIYSIPPSSPLHNVTYVNIYGATSEVVYVGYTPGYYGTVVSDEDVVVYGTGWYYPPYVGSYWVGYPWTYGFGVDFAWSSEAGWGVAFGVGWGYPMYYPWWGPPLWGPWCCYGPAWGYGGWGGFASVNAYGMWGNTAYSRTRAAWANPWTGNYGRAGGGRYYNTQTGAGGAYGWGSNYNAYTGNWARGAGGARYNPNTGIVAGGGAGSAGNIFTGNTVSGGGGFAYNTNTGGGIAAGKNNVFASKDGDVYRYNKNSGTFSKNTGNGWQTVDPPAGGAKTLQDRTLGQQRSSNFQRNTMSRPMPMRGGGRRR